LKKLLALLILLMLAGAAALYYTAFSPNMLRDATITVEPGDDYAKLRQKLAPYLKHSSTLDLTAQLKKFRTPKPGKYFLPAGLSNNDVINILRSGRQTEINVTFNQAHSLEQLAGKISRYITADSTELLQAFTDTDFLKKHGFTRETALLMYIPNTYRFYYTTSAEEFRDRMWKEYQRFWNDDRRAAAEKIGLSPVEVGILASIVQKETVIPSEKPMIAGVYLNRLKKGMKLEADPTAVYAYQLVTGDTSVIRRVLNKHISVDNPYNTYMYPGLPPGPIAMPDIQDLEAVLHPAEHSYYYFSADPKRPGYHLFASTYSEHLRNARAYREYLNRKGIKK